MMVEVMSGVMEVTRGDGVELRVTRMMVQTVTMMLITAAVKGMFMLRYACTRTFLKSYYYVF